MTKSLLKITEVNEALTDDLSQEVWIAFYLEMDEVEKYEDEGIRGWLYAVAKHRFLDFIKQSYEATKASGQQLAEYRRATRRIEEGVITRLMFEEYVARVFRKLSGRLFFAESAASLREKHFRISTAQIMR